MAQDKMTYAEILAQVDSLTTTARLFCVAPVLVQDESKTAEQRETLAKLAVELSAIISTVEELRNNNS
ncbi:MAG: hypothetical protein II284_03145 [Clostridia bacterium]|jgi:hypothetical protein|nr:hypothetical protein [Clostridia bacterium]MBQ5900759.1 hypothetical protein [Clostridia bacterium]